MHSKDPSKDFMIYPPKMTEEEYIDLLNRILKGAQYLANPLITEQDYKKGKKLYDELCEKAKKYRGVW
jgi:hypothetical protein